MKVFMAHGAWERIRDKYPIQETLTADISELQREIMYHAEMIDGKHPLGSQKYNSIVRFSSDAYKHQTILAELLRDSKACLQQDGNCEGWGLSLNSVEEAIDLCTATVEAYTKKKQEDAIAAEKERERKRLIGPLLKVLSFNHDGSCFDASNYEETTMTPEEIVEEIGGIMSSGQGPSDWGYSVMHSGWKGAQIEKLFALLAPEEKRIVWNALNSPEKMEIGTGEGDGTWLQCEIEWFAEKLGVKIEVIPANWKEV